MKRLKYLVLFFLVMSLFFSGCAQQQTDTDVTEQEAGEDVEQEEVQEESETSSSEDQQYKKELVVVLKGEPSNVDPHNNGELVAMTIQRHIYDNLVEKDENGNVIPEVATKWEAIDDTTVRFYLRDDVFFHNGENLTAEDVRFSIQRATEMPFSSAIFSGFDGENTKVVDDYTIDIVTKGPFAGIFNYLCSTRGAILHKETVQSLGDDEYGRNPLGSGAFVFEEWTTGTDIRLTRNENYWGQKPVYETIVFKFISEAATRAIEIESGNADISLDISPSDVPRLQENDDLNVVTGPSYGMSYVIFNNQDPVMSDILVREALSISIDKPSLVEAVYGSLATPAESVIPSTVFAYESQGLSEYNPDKAKDLLSEAGYSDGLSVKLSVPDTQEARDLAEIIQNFWSQIGVTTEITISAMPEFIAAGRRGDNQLGISAANYTTGDPGHALADFDTRTNAFFHSNDTQIDDLLDQGMAIYDPDERSLVYKELQSYITEQFYMIPLANKMVTYVTTSNIDNFFCDPGNAPYLGQVLPKAD